MEEKEKLEDVPAVQENKKELTEEEKGQVIALLKVRRENLLRLVASGKVRSINRAMKRDRILPNGILKWSRPFNNRANTSSRKGIHSRVSNEERKRFYETFKRKAA
jgi:hypothetical protein